MSEAMRTVILVVAGLVVVGLVLTLVRAVIGPTVYDRILAVNVLGSSAVGLVALMGFFSGRPEFLDIGLVYALLNFVGTIAILRFIERRELG